MLKIDARIQGTAPLLMHNSRLADPLDYYTKAMKQITSKRGTKTEDELEELARLEWIGSLYYDSSVGPYITDLMIQANLVKGASAKRGGKKLAQSAFFVQDVINPLIYEGSRDPAVLVEDANHRLVAIARIPSTGARVTRTRPKFPEWALEFTMHLDTEIVSFADFEVAFERAGTIEGIGDWRPRYGRYTVESLEKSELV